MHNRGYRLTILTLIAAAGFAAPAFAQNALGDGRGLQRDLRVGGNNNFDRGDINAEIRLRNAIVTGNAPGGRSFRGDVGYTAPNEFRGSLATDSLFAFRRDSLSSSFASQGIRGADAIRYQSAYTTGGVPSLPAGVLRLGPTGIASVPGPVLARGADQRAESWEGVQSLDAAVNTLRSTTAFTAARSLSPGVVGMQATPGGAREVTASSLMGLRTVNPGDRMTAERSWMMTSDRYRQGYRPGEQTEQTEGENAEAESPLNAAVSAAPRSATERAVRSPVESVERERAVRTAYDDVRDRLKGFQPGLGERSERAEPDENDPLDWENRLQQLREQLDRGGRPMPGEGVRPRPEAPAEAPDRDGVTARSIDRMTGQQDGVPRGPIDEETLRLIREAGAEVDSFVKGDYSPDNLYAYQMDRGQKALAQGRYFDAEERFTRAISYRPGDVTAQAGRVHSQLGAGLFVSAALNLQSLLTTHPEVIGVRYQGSTLPPKARVDQLIKQLGDDISRAEQGDVKAARSSALLLAYLGFQSGNSTAARRGLDTLSDIAEPSDPLPRLLKGVWLETAVAPKDEPGK